MSYDITEEDLRGYFPYSKMLQNRWGTKGAYKYVYNRIEYVSKKFKAGKISFEQAKVRVAEVIDEARDKFPTDFEIEGWFDKRERQKRTYKTLASLPQYVITIQDLVDLSIPLPEVFLNDYVEGFNYNTRKCAKKGYARSLHIMYSSFMQDISKYSGKKILKKGPPDMVRYNREIYELVVAYRRTHSYLFKSCIGEKV